MSESSVAGGGVRRARNVREVGGADLEVGGVQTVGATPVGALLPSALLTGGAVQRRDTGRLSVVDGMVQGHSVLVAAVDSLPTSKAQADFVVEEGQSAADVLNAAIAYAASLGTPAVVVKMLEGTYAITSAVQLVSGVSLVGLGADVSVLYTSAYAGNLVEVDGDTGCVLRDFALVLDPEVSVTPEPKVAFIACGRVKAERLRLDRVGVSAADAGVSADLWFESCRMEGGQQEVFDTNVAFGGTGRVRFTGMWMRYVRVDAASVDFVSEGGRYSDVRFYLAATCARVVVTGGQFIGPAPGTWSALYGGAFQCESPGAVFANNVWDCNPARFVCTGANSVVFANAGLSDSPARYAAVAHPHADMAYATRRQDNTTNSTVSNQLIQSGWGVLIGDGSSFALNDTAVTFPVAFDDVPLVVVSAIGTRPSADGAPTGPGWFTGVGNFCGRGYGTSVSGFTPRVQGLPTDAAGTTAAFASNVYYAYAWIAIGTKAR